VAFPAMHINVVDPTIPPYASRLPPASRLSAVSTTHSFLTWDDIRIAYREWNRESSISPPVVLHHGFVAHAEANWVAPGVVERLVAAGRHVIAPDARGHGESDKPHDPSAYGEQRMARDLAALFDLIEAPRIDLVGYSMGAVVSLIFSSEHDRRVRRLVVGGVGSGIVECGGVDRRVISNESIIDALATDDPSTIEAPGAKAFRWLADALGSDRQALIAHASSIHRSGIALGLISAPTLVVAGDRDPLAVRPETLAAAIPDASLEILSGNHMEALADPRFAQSIVEFLA
jgi:pimeloyl-ACP methyl ester carboxylesterase